MYEIDIYNPDLYRPSNKGRLGSIFSGSDFQTDITSGFLSTLKKIPGFLDLIEDMKNSGVYEYVARITDEQKEMLEKGVAKLGKSHEFEGDFFPTFYQEGETKTILSLKKQNMPSDVMSSLTTLSMQSQLADLSNKLDGITTKLTIIEAGQRSDRVAKANRAKLKLIQALSAESDTSQTQYYQKAAELAEDAMFELFEALKTDLKLINDSKTKKADKDRLNQEVVEEMKFITESSFISAYSYTAIGESNAAIALLMDFKTQISDTFNAKLSNGRTNAEMLYDNWNYKKSSANIDWRKIPKQICSELELKIEQTKKLEIPLTKILDLPEGVVLRIE